MKNIFLFLFVLLTFALQAQTVVDIVVNSPDHNTLEAAVIAAELADDLSGEGPFTVFAPTDAAFSALPDGVVSTLLEDPTGDLANILLNHVVNGVASPDNIFDGLVISTLLGQNITFTTDGGLAINGVNISVVDIKAENGVVHVIDGILLPAATPTRVDGTVLDVVATSPDHTTLASLVGLAGLGDALAADGTLTVFAPTDAAFAALPSEIVDALVSDPTGALTDVLLYHVVSGGATTMNISDGSQFSNLAGSNLTVTINDTGVFINDAQVTVADIRTNNGIVHVIDAVLVPPMATTVVDVIVNSPDHNTLEAAVVAAGLVDALSGPGPFTVFAPTDAAFAALPDGLVATLLEDPTGDLTNILLYHVVSGVAESAAVVDGLTISTLLGQNISFSVNDDGVFINDAKISVFDIRTDNGIIHVIDAVLVP